LAPSIKATKNYSWSSLYLKAALDARQERAWATGRHA
jgi:hypothetical protein